MKLRETTECPNCTQLARRVAKLEKQLTAAFQRIDKLEQENTQLKQQLAAACYSSAAWAEDTAMRTTQPDRRARARIWTGACQRGYALVGFHEPVHL